MPKLPEGVNIAHEIIEAACDDHSAAEIVETAKTLLDLALNHDGLDEYVRAQIIGKMCWRFGLEPPDSVQEWLV